MKITCLPILTVFCALPWASTTWAACPPPIELATLSSSSFIPRDAPSGSMITSGILNYDGTRKHSCAGRPVNLEMLAGPAVSPLLAANDGSLHTRQIGDHLFQTNIPGISIGAIMVDAQLCTSPGGDLIPDSQRYFPLNAYSCPRESYQTRVYYYLFKTGDLPPGNHTLSGQVLRVLFDGRVQSSLTLNHTVTVAGCSMPESTGNQIEVAMAPTTVNDFSGKGTFGEDKGFSIDLHSCVKGSYSSYYPWNYFQGNYAHVRFEPSRGSTIVDAPMGVVGLRPESTAKGIGVQILRADKSPMALGTEVQIQHVQDGTTTLPFHARYIQVSDSAPEGGTADATVNFTVTFR